MSDAHQEGGKTVKQINKDHFDNFPEDGFMIQWIRDMHEKIASYLVAHRDYIGIPESASFEAGTGIRILDYACGNGILSIALAPYASHLRGIDISQKMVQLYSKKAAEAQFSPDRMRAVEADLISGGDPSLSEAAAGPEFEQFDLAFISMAIHHMEDPVVVLRGIASRLAPGGKLLVIDWQTPDEDKDEDSESKAAETDHHHGHMHLGDVKVPTKTVVRSGYTKEEMLDIFDKAGLVEGKFQVHPDATELPGAFANRKRNFFARPFFAVAEKAKI